MHRPFVIVNAIIYLENEILDHGYLYMEGGKIRDIGMNMNNNDWTMKNVDVIDLKGVGKVIPGLIDIHIHGANGSDAMDGKEDAIRNIASTLPKEGTTSFLATTITQSTDEIETALKSIANFNNNEELESIGAELLGIHLEGPFISTKQAGAQSSEHMMSPNIELFKSWEMASNHLIKIVTFAPEEGDGLAFASYLHNNQIIPSIGHSDAIYEQMKEVITLGACHATHLFNGMRGLHHREPGVLGSALLFREIVAELIVDGIHISPPMVKFSYENKGKDGIILITDAMRAKGLGAGEYALGGQKVRVDDSKAVLEDGTLAGSILMMNHALKNMISYTGCSLNDALVMAAVNPAKQLQVFDRKGSIAIGKDADLVVIDNDYEVNMTFCKGNRVYMKEVIR